MKYYPKIARRVSGVWASADGVALELRMDGRFEERHDDEIAFTGHYEIEGDDVRPVRGRRRPADRSPDRGPLEPDAAAPPA